MGSDPQLDELKAKHAELEHELEELNAQIHPDDTLISQIKKQKLLIKDEIAQIAGP